VLPCPPWINEEEPPDKLEDIARAAVAVYEFILRQNQKRHLLNHGHLKTWHGKLFESVVPVPYYAGHYRCADSRYPCLNVNNHVAGVSGAPFEDVADRMQLFSEALESGTIDTDKFVATHETPELKLKAALQLAAFAAGSVIQIHPFLNGNGKTARLAANFFCNRYGYGMPFFLNRPWPNSPAAEYSTACRAAMASGDFRPLFRYLILLLAR
jgi:fido (protein-threonine AMPylation protein)